MLKWYDSTIEKCHPIEFNFGNVERERFPGVKGGIVNLDYYYELEREVLEKICQLSDEGHIVVAGNVVIMDKFEGAKLLMKIDLDAPSYSHMDDPVSIPF